MERLVLDADQGHGQGQDQVHIRFTQTTVGMITLQPIKTVGLDFVRRLCLRPKSLVVQCQGYRSKSRSITRFQLPGGWPLCHSALHRCLFVSFLSAENEV